ncbi:hypothetical protein O6H91_04G016500 [Diphasiastrum complanatum]|uniref:Uncharacterized protein n=1 Tax=Diphasiastrum complanatum TaxID=34168 RepID=A0ACC2DUY4_DIPCM|nr:hypothetical protein O6H91_04G016500 [Diphasiastrum complanatum]
MRGSGMSWLLILSSFVFYLVAFGLALGANAHRSKVTIQYDYGSEITVCKYTKDVATGLGVGAFLFLLLGQVLITGFTRCLCCSTALRPGSARVFAIIFFIFSWLSFIVAAICLIAGATRAAYRTRATGYFGADNLTCETLRKGIFEAAAAFTLFTLLLSEGYYLCQVKAQEQNWQPYNYGGPTVGC